MRKSEADREKVKKAVKRQLDINLAMEEMEQGVFAWRRRIRIFEKQAWSMARCFNEYGIII